MSDYEVIHIDEVKTVQFGLNNFEEKEAKTSENESSEKSEHEDEVFASNTELNHSSTEPVSSDKNLNKSDSSASYSPISCYLCIKVNNNKDFVTCPMNRKMKNKLRSEFWFQFNDNW